MKGSISRGALYCGNKQAYRTIITTDSSGNGSSTVSFRTKQRNAPYVTGLSFNEEVATGVLSASSITQSSAKIFVKGCSVTSDTVSVAFEIFDDTYY